MINSFSFIFGPWNHYKSLITRERLPFTATYFTSLFLTLYFAMFLKSTLLTSGAAIFQVIALLWYLVSYIPGGKVGLAFMSKMFTKVVTSTCGRVENDSFSPDCFMLFTLTHFMLFSLIC